MKMTFRWYGETDSIPLRHIRQIPNMSGVVITLPDIPVGEVWELDRLLQLKKTCNENGLDMDVLESLPVHEDIKLGKPTRDALIENYKKSLINLGKAGVKVVCYNFMPVFDWLRTDFKTELEDGSNASSYTHAKLLSLDKTSLHLPGWEESYSVDELHTLLDEYSKVSHDQLFENLVYFLNAVMPACEEADINLAVHPDDPPWDMFSLPRIITCKESYERLFNAVPNKHNGMVLCTGALGAGRRNNLPEIAARFTDRIFFCHIRQLLLKNDYDFIESGHMTNKGNLDIYQIVRQLVLHGFKGYVRPDHGRNIWDEDGKPGYGLFDRALGACYLHGLFEAISKDNNIKCE